MMITGKDRGKRGKVLMLVPRYMKIMVEGLNLVKKHLRPRKQGQKGQIIQKERLIDVSNVQLICPKCGKPVRIGHRLEGGNKIRVCRKCGLAI